MKNVTPTESAELIPLEGLTPAILFDPESGKMEKVLEDLKKAALAKKMTGDTEDGRTLCMRHKNLVVTVQKFFHSAKISETKVYKEKANKIDVMGKLANDTCEELKTEIMKPRKDFEEKNATRQAKHMARLNMISEKRGPTGRILKEHLAFLDARKVSLAAIVIGPAWEEFEERARSEKSLSVEWVAKEIVAVTQAIKDDERLKELEADVIKRKADAKTEAAKASPGAVETAQPVSPGHASKPEEDKTFGGVSENFTVEHRGTVNRAILAQFIGLGLQSAMSKQLISLMAKGKIEHVKILY